MTKLFSLVAVLFISFSAFAQSNLTINFCNKPAKEIKIEDLINCKLLSVDNPEYKVFSFTVGFISGKDYIEVKLKDNTLTEQAINLITKHNPTVMYIEQIVLINTKGEKTHAEPFKVKSK